MSAQTKPPDFKSAVVMPDCCGTCEDFAAEGADYDDSPPYCYKYKAPCGFDFESYCSDYRRDEAVYPREI